MGVNKRPALFLSVLLYVRVLGYSLGYLAIKKKNKKQNQNHKSTGVVCYRKRAEKSEVGQKLESSKARQRDGASPHWSDTALAGIIGATREARVTEWGSSWTVL